MSKLFFTKSLALVGISLITIATPLLAQAQNSGDSVPLELQNFSSIDDVIVNVNTNNAIPAGEKSAFKEFLVTVKASGGTVRDLQRVFQSGQGTVADLNRVLQGDFNVGQINNVLKDFNRLGGRLDQLTGGGLSDLLGNIKGSFGIQGDLTGLSGVLKNVQLLGGDWNDLMGDFTDIKGLFGKLGDFNNLGNLGAMSDILDKFWNMGATWDNLGQSLNGVLDSFGNVPGLSLVGDALNGLISGGKTFTDLIATNGTLNGIAESLKGLAGITGGSDVLGGAAGGLSDILGSDAVDLLGAARLLDTNRLQCSSLLPKITFAGAAGIPVMEVGPVLGLTTGIEWNTAQISDISTKICMNLAVIKRIQLAFEKKAFVDDPGVRAQASGNVERYKQQFSTFLNRGYISADSISNNLNAAGPNGGTQNVAGLQGDSPLFIQNMDNHLLSIRKEVQKNYLETVANSGNLYSTDLNTTLTEESAKSSASNLRSSVTKQDIANLKSGNTTGTGWWNTLLSVTDPSNNFEGSYLIASGDLADKKAIAEQNAREEAIGAGGFLPKRTCLKQNAAGTACALWKIDSPASIIAQAAKDVGAARLNQLESADTYGELNSGDLPVVSEVATLRPAASGSGNSLGNILGNASSLQDLLNKLGQLTGQKPADLANDDSNGDAIPDILQQAPLVSFTLKIPTAVALALHPTTSSATLSWNAPSASVCQASNDWIGRMTGATSTSVLIPAYTTLNDITGTIPVGWPLGFELQLVRNRFDPVSSSTVSTILPITTTGTNTSPAYAITLVGADVAKDDQFILQARLSTLDTGNSLTVTAASNGGATAVIAALKQAYAALPTTDGLRRFSLVFGATQITAKLQQGYQIKCFNQFGVTEKTASIVN